MAGEERAMAVGNLWQRSAPALAVGLLIGLAGCQSLPVPRAHPAFKAGGDDPSAPPPAGQVAPVPGTATPVASEVAVPPPGTGPLAAANEPLPPLPVDGPETASPQRPEGIVEALPDPGAAPAPDPNAPPKPTRPAVDPVLDELIAKAQAYRQEQAQQGAEQFPAPIAKDPEPAPEPQPVDFLPTADPLGDILRKAAAPAPEVGPPVADLKLDPETGALVGPAESPAPDASTVNEPETCDFEIDTSPEPPVASAEVPLDEAKAATPEPNANPITDSPSTPALAITDLRLCRRVLGFGNFLPLDSLGCKAGQTILLYCEMEGVRYQPHEHQFLSRIASRVEIVPESGGSPVWVQTLGEADDCCNHPRHDYYVNYRFALPRNLEPGPYRLRIVQTDLHTEQTATHDVSFSINP